MILTLSHFRVAEGDEEMQQAQRACLINLNHRSYSWSALQRRPKNIQCKAFPSRRRRWGNAAREARPVNLNHRMQLVVGATAPTQYTSLLRQFPNRRRRWGNAARALARAQPTLTIEVTSGRHYSADPGITDTEAFPSRRRRWGNAIRDLSPPKAIRGRRYSADPLPSCIGISESPKAMRKCSRIAEGNSAKINLNPRVNNRLGHIARAEIAFSCRPLKGRQEKDPETNQRGAKALILPCKMTLYKGHNCQRQLWPLHNEKCEAFLHVRFCASKIWRVNHGKLPTTFFRRKKSSCKGRNLALKKR